MMMFGTESTIVRFVHNDSISLSLTEAMNLRNLDDVLQWVPNRPHQHLISGEVDFMGCMNRLLERCRRRGLRPNQSGPNETPVTVASDIYPSRLEVFICTTVDLAKLPPPNQERLYETVILDHIDKLLADKCTRESTRPVTLEFVELLDGAHLTTSNMYWAFRRIAMKILKVG